jgi:hypothetical protein
VRHDGVLHEIMPDKPNSEIVSLSIETFPLEWVMSVYMDSPYRSRIHSHCVVSAVRNGNMAS